jgi:hypothetical protein
MQDYKPLDENNSVKELLAEAFRLLKIAVKKTDINLIDNYGYREYAALETLRELLPSAKKTIGRTGDDASAIGDGYMHIEQKSGTRKGKTLTMTNFPDMLFDKQSDPVRRKKVYDYDGFSLSFFEFYNPIPTALVFVPKEHVKRLHPLIDLKQQEKIKEFEKRISEGKNIGHDPIIIKLPDIVEYVGEQNLVCWLYGERIDSVEFFRKIRNKEIKINQ